MSITTVNSELLATCSDCGTEQYGGTLEFADFLKQLKVDGWKIKKEDGEWLHLCPECQ